MRSLTLALLLVPALAFGQTTPPEGAAPPAEDLLTTELTTTKHLTPDGTGGVEWTAPAAATPVVHATSHENGGADEIDVTGLTGLPTAYDGGPVSTPIELEDTASLVFEGPTDDAWETTLNSLDNTIDTTLVLPTSGGLSYPVSPTVMVNVCNGCSADGGSPEAVAAVWGIYNGLAFEGLNKDAFQTQLTVEEATATTKTITLPNASGDAALLPAAGASTFALATTLVTNEVDVANSVWGASNGLVFEGATGGADTFETTLTLVDPTADNVITLQNATGTVAFLSDVGGGGPTRVSQAANLVTSAVYTSADATNLLFTPANSTEYYIQGKVFVASDTVAYGVGFQFTFPTTDAIAGSCTAYIPKQTTAGDILTAPAASGATTSQISGANTVSPAGTVAVYTIDCYLSTTTNTSGNFAVLFGGENGGGSYTLYAGSYIDYEALP